MPVNARISVEFKRCYYERVPNSNFKWKNKRKCRIQATLVVENFRPRFYSGDETFRLLRTRKVSTTIHFRGSTQSESFGAKSKTLRRHTRFTEGVCRLKFFRNLSNVYSKSTGHLESISISIPRLYSQVSKASPNHSVFRILYTLPAKNASDRDAQGIL